MATLQRNIVVVWCIYFTLEQPVDGKVANSKHQGVIL